MAERSSCPGSRPCLHPPDVRVVSGEPRLVHLQLGDELAARALIAVGHGIQAAVDLIERLKGEPWEAQPGRPNLRLRADRQAEAANRKHVGTGTEVQVEIGAAGNLRASCSVELPM